ncbi:MAG: site-specific integrase, partial [Gammaproteobacteria bacterium]|nr:site-specific integrase [Gammaproteobacteria bacterium]
MAASGTPGPRLEESATAFLDYLRDVRQLSPHTLSNYQRDLLSLQRYCAE